MDAAARRRGPTTLGLPTEYGGGGDIGGSIAAFETLAFGDLSLLVKTGVQFGLFGGAILHLGTKRHHEAYLADIASLELPGCFAMSESGHGSDVQSVGTTATYDARDRGVRDRDADAGRPQGLDRQRRRARARGRRLRAADHRRREPRRARLRRPDPQREGQAARRGDGSRTADTSSASTASTTGASTSTASGFPRDNLLDRYASVTERRPLQLADREPDRRASSRWSGPWSRAGSRSPAPALSVSQGGADDRDPPRQPPPPVRPARAAARRCCCSTTARTSGGCCRCWPAPTRCNFIQRELVAELDAVFSGERATTSMPAASSRPTPPASRPTRPGTGSSPCRPAARPAAGSAT